MKTNFYIEDYIAIKNTKFYFDLHNNFDFVKFEYDINLQELILYFEKSKEDWAKNEQFDFLELSHKNVIFYKLIIVDKEASSDDRNTLSNITFISSDEEDIDVLVDITEPQETDDILYTFENNSFIRISCKEICVSYH
jgi:hypothetical protein